MTQAYFIIFLEIIRRKQASKHKIFPANIKSMNPIQKYPHIIELSACILNILS